MTRHALVLLLTVVLMLTAALLPQALAAKERATLTGGVAYSLPFKFDVDRDEDLEKVQFWVEFDIKGPIGKPGTPQYVPASGTLGYYMLVLKTGKKIWNWMDLYMGQMPRKRRHTLRNITFEGKTVRFKAVGMSWTVTDGGPGFAKDVVRVGVGKAKRVYKLAAGDVTVVPIPKKPAAKKPNAKAPKR